MRNSSNVIAEKVHIADFTRFEVVFCADDSSRKCTCAKIVNKNEIYQSVALLATAPSNLDMYLVTIFFYSLSTNKCIYREEI